MINDALVYDDQPVSDASTARAATNSLTGLPSGMTVTPSHSTSHRFSRSFSNETRISPASIKSRALFGRPTAVRSAPRMKWNQHTNAPAGSREGSAFTKGRFMYRTARKVRRALERFLFVDISGASLEVVATTSAAKRAPISQTSAGVFLLRSTRTPRTFEATPCVSASFAHRASPFASESSARTCHPRSAANTASRPAPHPRSTSTFLTPSALAAAAPPRVARSMRGSHLATASEGSHSRPRAFRGSAPETTPTPALCAIPRNSESLPDAL
mmetsp:Transcript_5848/g.24801  ORF Transcript_5848/g.24801 Transcript_5848/m.24801 type:complete len:272 (-) Transcript_5848:432-1247(-)